MQELEPLLRRMLAEQASDVFLTEGRVPSFRVNGEIRPSGLPATTRAQIDTFMAATLRPGQREAFDRLGGVDFGVSLGDLGRFRMHYFMQRGLVSAVVRSVPNGQLDFEALGLPPYLQTLAESPRGLVLVTGSTGSGKSTTLAAMIHHINKHSRKHIVTLEDPIEFVHDDIEGLVTQREIGSDARDYASALKHVLRENPDVILIGEMRDAETMNVALSAALTGHLVLSSLHTLDTTQALQRILSYYPEYMRAQVCMDLALCLQGIVGQRLVPRADGQGRLPAVEILVATPPVSKLIRDQRVEEIGDLMLQGDGMQTFNRSLVKMFEQNLITFETGAAYATNPDEFRLNAQGMERGTGALVQELENLPSLGSLDMRTLLRVALRYGASDLHIIVGTPPTFRVHGKLHRLRGTEPLTPGDVRRLLFSLLNNHQRESFELDRELDFALSVTGSHRFRVNAHFQRGTPAASLRLIPSTIPDPATLGIPAVMFDLAQRPQGLVLVTGPTGSGKSTTLATMIDLVNTQRSCHIIAIEDPIEFIHTNKSATVEQREVGADTKSFAAALKFILRQDPDVILIGEMRDVETISAALTAAETGHLVLATLHTNDAAQSVERIVDVFPPFQQSQIRTQLAGALLAVVAQRLLDRRDGHGRVAAFEVLVATGAVRAIIRDGKTHQLQSVIETSRNEGMITMDRSLSDLVRNGTVPLEEAARFVRNPQSFRAHLDAPVPAGEPLVTG